jgi:hypothetical protein
MANFISTLLSCPRCSKIKAPTTQCSRCGFYKGWDYNLDCEGISFNVGSNSIYMSTYGTKTIIFNSNHQIIAYLPFRVDIKITEETLSKYMVLV